MDVAYIANEVRRIAASRGDYEVAHSMEDSLMTEFIEYVASQTVDASLAEMAREVLKTRDIDFARYCS